MAEKKEIDRVSPRAALPGVKKEDVSVEVTDGRLVLSGERKSETEEKQEDVYRCEREYGSFSRTVPLPARQAAKARKVEIQEPSKAAKPAA